MPVLCMRLEFRSYSRLLIHAFLFSKVPLIERNASFSTGSVIYFHTCQIGLVTMHPWRAGRAGSDSNRKQAPIPLSLICGCRQFITASAQLVPQFWIRTSIIDTAVIPKINDACSLPAALPPLPLTAHNEAPELIPIMQNMQPRRFTQTSFKKDGIQLAPHVGTANQRTVHRFGLFRTPTGRIRRTRP